MYDVVIIGGGIAGSSLVYNLRKHNPTIGIALVEKPGARAQHKSYYVKKDLLAAYGATHIIHNELHYQSKETDLGYQDRNSFGEHAMGSVDYARLCAHLSQGAELIRDTVTSVDQNSITLKTGDILEAPIIVDATGHTSFLRKQFGLRRPKLGVEVIMYDLKGAELDDWQTVRLGLGNITNWGVWIEPKDEQTGRAYLGTGNLKYLDQPEDRDLLQEMIDQYMEFYDDLFGHASVERETFATIAADPVRQVIHNEGNIQYAWLGESAGQVDPYWSIGHGRILDLAEKLSNSIVALLAGEADTLDSYQSYWEEQLFSFYKKNWARARLFYSLDQDEWQELFERREQLKDELNGKEQVERQSGSKSYGLLHTLKLVGLKNILKYLNYQRIFKKRLTNRAYWDQWEGEIRSSLLPAPEAEV